MTWFWRQGMAVVGLAMVIVGGPAIADGSAGKGGLVDGKRFSLVAVSPDGRHWR